MKDLMEEYGALVVTIIIALVILVTLGGGVWEFLLTLVKMFIQSLGGSYS